MSIEEGAKFVAAAYAVILAVLVCYYILSARRVNTIQRDVELLEQEVARRGSGVRTVAAARYCGTGSRCGAGAGTAAWPSSAESATISSAR